MKKNIIIIFLVIICLILVVFGIKYFKKDDNILYNADTGEPLEMAKTSAMTHIIVKGKLNNEINPEATPYTYTIIYTFDENDIAVNERQIEQYETKEDAQQRYTSLLDNMFTNISISENTVMFNRMVSDSLTKAKVLETSRNSTADEILEY
jgi:hypothetical protein